MKKKGYSLLMAIVSIGIIAALAAAVSALALASYRNAANENRRVQLRLKAENGIEQQVHYIKDYILKNFAKIYLDPNKTMDETKITEADDLNPTDGIRRDIELEVKDSLTGNDKYTDPRTGRDVYYIKIISTCQYKNGDDLVGKPLKIEVVIDRSTIYNEYFERTFNRASFTTAPTQIGSAIDSKFTLMNKPLETSGSMFLQGEVNFSPKTTDLTFYQGEVKVKSPDDTYFHDSIVSEIITGTSDFINLSKDDGSAGNSIWKNKKMSYLPMCKIMTPSDNPEADDAQIVSGTSAIIDSNLVKDRRDPTDPTKLLKLITYKAEGTNINFQELIDGADLKGDSDDSLYYKICQKLQSDPRYTTDYLDHYGEYYKVILIDGDLDIKDDDFRIYNNYVLYVTGKVTFEGRAEFYNSSIFAKEIEIRDKVIFNGVNTKPSSLKKIGDKDGTELLDFDDDMKTSINDYFIKNLENYGDYLKFNKLYWYETYE